MTARRVHLPPDRIEAGRARLTDEARHHLVDVLRLRPGAVVEVFDGAGGAFEGVLEEGLATLRLGAPRAVVRASVPVHLLFALAKGEKADLVVQKATELGARVVAPFEAARAVVRLERAKAEERARRWRRIAEEAARQCGRADVPEVKVPAPLGEALAALPAPVRAFVFQPGGAALATLEGPEPGAVCAIVGPEGGLTDAEVALCERAGAVRTSLGPRVLRAETAAIVATALLQARFGDLS